MVRSLPFTRKWSLASLLLKQTYENTYVASKLCLASWVPLGCFLGAGCSWMLIAGLLHKSSRWVRRHVFLFIKNTCIERIPVQQEVMSNTCHDILLDKKMCLVVEQEDISSCSARRHVFLFSKIHVFLFNTKTCLRVQQEDMSPCRQEDVSSCPYGHNCLGSHAGVVDLIPSMETIRNVSK